jgi:hypothetical protein
MDNDTASADTNRSGELQNSVNTIQSPIPDLNPKKKVPVFKYIFLGLIITVIIISVSVFAFRIYMSKPATGLLFQNQLDSTKGQNSTADYQNESGTRTENTQTNAPDVNYKINYEFARYKLDQTGFKPAVPEYSLTVKDLSNIPNFEKASGKPLSDAQKNSLTSLNFYITANSDKFWNDDPDAPLGGISRTDDWAGLYRKIGGGSIAERAPENSVFVSTDYLLHIYHRLLEKEFEYIENKKFYPVLRDITDTVLNQAITGYVGQSDTENKHSFERIIAYFAVPKSILDSAIAEQNAHATEDQKLDTRESILQNLENLKSNIPEFSYQKAKAELNLILDQKTISESPLFGELLSQENLQSPQDYTQYTPRSHYNKNSILRTYFRSMMWYGRNNFTLASSGLTRDALNISLLMSRTGQLKNWEYIYIPTAFLAGKSDDLGIYEYITDLNKSGAVSVNADTVTRIQTDMKNYQGPQIQSSVFIGTDVMKNSKAELLNKTKGFRFMGQRFTPDGLIFSSLTQGNEKPDPVTGQSLPSMTTALMVMNVLGNQTSEPLVSQWISAKAPDSDKILNKNIGELKNQFAKITDDVWTQNIYWGWLYTIRALFTEKSDKTGYPMFMKNEAWNKKNLLTSLGSWTELKHDTLLYAKQSYAEMGGGGEPENPPPVPKGYVEPNIIFFDRLISLVNMTVEGLKNRDLIDSTFIGRNEIFLKSLVFFRKIAVSEIQNEKISDADFEKLRIEAGFLSIILDALPGDQLTEKDARAALVADVHTDIPDGLILYEANGIPNYIYVAVKDANGTRLTKGLVFNYYEFSEPIGQRLDDQTWWKRNYTQDKSRLPSPPEWSKSMIQ